MGTKKRYSLVSTFEKEDHIFPIYDYDKKALSEKQNLNDLDYFIYCNNCENKEDLKKCLLNHYSEVLKYLSKNTKGKLTKKNLIAIQREVIYLSNMRPEAGFQISYKSNGYIKYLPVLYNLTCLQEYFLSEYHDLNRDYSYNQKEVEAAINNNKIYQEYKRNFLDAFQYDEGFQSYINKNSFINSYLKNFILDHLQYRSRNESNEFEKTSDLDAYNYNEENLFQQLATYKNIRGFLHQINNYNTIYNRNILGALEEKIRLMFEEVTMRQRPDIDYDKLEEQLTSYGKDLETLPLEFQSSIDGTGKRR